MTLFDPGPTAPPPEKSADRKRTADDRPPRGTPTMPPEPNADCTECRHRLEQHGHAGCEYEPGPLAHCSCRTSYLQLLELRHAK